jgi:hypothetical protein
MQIDDRAFPDWVALQNDQGVALWMFADQNIAKGANVLSAARQALPGAALTEIIDAYNAGAVHEARTVAAGKDPDSVTTGGDYSQWVLEKIGPIHSSLRGTNPCSCDLCVFMGTASS